MNARLLILSLVFCVGTAQAERRALVIGNGRYNPNAAAGYGGNLKNPEHDADLMEQTLRSVGFYVTKHIDVDSSGLRQALRQFRERLQKGDTVVVYYSGHGIQLQGENYLLPVRFDAKYEYEAREQAMALGSITAALDEAQPDLKIIFLDCCRDTPEFARSYTKSALRGLSEISPASDDTLVCYATKHGEVAADNPDRPNSNYTASLAEEIPKQGQKVEDTMKAVSRKVVALSSGTQRPFIYGHLLQDFYFAGTAGSNSGSSPAPTISAPPPPSTEVLDELRRMRAEIERLRNNPPASTSPSANTGTSAELPPVTVAPQPEVGSVDQVKSELVTFLQSWFDHQHSNDPGIWADDFAALVDYCYKKSGPATRSFIVEDRRKLVERWPSRDYTLVGKPSYQTFDGGTKAVMSVKFSYSYGGSRATASGTSQVELTLTKEFGRWKISGFEESVNRN